MQKMIDIDDQTRSIMKFKDTPARSCDQTIFERHFTPYQWYKVVPHINIINL